MKKTNSKPNLDTYRERLLNAAARVAELKRQVAGLEKLNDHLRAELDADVEHILALSKERDELLAENKQLKRALKQELAEVNPAQVENEA
ncbi:MAG: hypothetical protein GWN87_24930 [Desulfuromonadales bacterium]|nr:hypothetical protein [Desulfuromonadales bacterium]